MERAVRCLGLMLPLLVACEVAAPGDAVNTDGEAGACADGAQTLVRTPRLVRLTHVQYDNVVRDLLGYEGEASAGFIDDPGYAGFDNNAAALGVSDRLARDYRRAAETIAAEAASEPDFADRVAACRLDSGDECVAAFIAALGQRAYRRPLTAREHQAYVEHYGAAYGSYAEGSADEQGMRLVIETMLQSSHFLYRVELSSDVDGDTDLIPLDSWELASRLSFLLWNSMPDDELLEAAAAQDLGTPEALEAQATRMVEDPRARHTVADFHRQWLGLDGLPGLSKSAELHPQWDPALVDPLAEETQRFIEYVAFELDGGFGDLLTSKTTFLNEDIAPLYGVQADLGAEFQRWDFEPEDPRTGLLTQAGFLAGHAYADRSSPIHRGVFVQRQMLCLDLPDPPADIDLELPEIDGEEIETTRQQVEAHTGADACQSCHGLINPAGFAFEHYDAVGGYRERDNGVAVDASGQLVLGEGAPVDFTDALELSEALAASESARRCYLRNWFRYGFARFETGEDGCTLDELHDQLQDADYDLTAILVAFTQTTSFRYRAADGA